MELHFVNKEKYSFYNVTNDEIEKVEIELNIKFPNELKEFYASYGYGFLGSEDGFTNRIMDPFSIRDFRLVQNDYEFFVDIELYKNFEDGRLVFFEQDETAIFSIELTDNKISKVFYYDTVVANSLEEFLNRMLKNELYYLDLIG